MSNIHLIVTIYSHHFSCKAITPRGNNLCDLFGRKFVQWGVKFERGRYLRQAVKVYATKTADNYEYRFHINVYDQWLEHLKFNQVDIDTQVQITTEPYPESTDIKLKVREHYTPREGQIPVIEYMVADGNNKLVTAQTGSGKTVMTWFALEKISKVAAIIVRPQFMQKLRSDIIEQTDCTSDDIIMVQGNAQLLKLLELAKYNELNCKFVIMSNKTIQIWYKQYEKLRDGIFDLGYECYPYELFSMIKAGIRIVDEVHLDLHLQCKIDLYTHIEHSISLSATLLSDDPFIRKMQEMLYPLKDRYDSGEVNKYIDTFGVTYALETMNGIRTTEFGSASYSQTAYEKSLMKNRPRLMKYLNMIDWILNESYFKVTREKKKFLIYVGSIMLAGVVTNFLKQKYPHLDIRRYCEDDPYENLLDPDIRVSTVLSAGTGHDVKNLVGVLLTIALSSIQANIQSLGRLRQLPDGHPVEFYWLTCKDIPKHLEYHKAKEDLMSKRAKSYKLLQSGFRI